MSTDVDTDVLLSLLGEERVREILRATSEEPMSAKELSEKCGVAQSTIYRRVEEMQTHDLLVEQTQLESDGNHYSVYSANVDHIDIDVGSGSIEVQMNTREDAAERFSKMWDNMREN